MKVVIYFKKIITLMLIAILANYSSIAFSASVGIQDGQIIVAPHNELQGSSHSGAVHQLATRSITPEIATKEFVGVIEQPTIVVMISFNDQQVSTDLAEWENRIFTDRFSVRSFFEGNSNGKFAVTPAIEGGVIHVELDRNHPDFGSNYAKSIELANQALEQAVKQIDLEQFDTNNNKTIEVRELAFVLVAAGYEKSFGGEGASHPNVWGHQSSGTILSEDYRVNGYVLFGEKHGAYQASIGIICHELGHLYFNLPDLYDRDGSSAGAGNWGVMGYGTWGSSGVQLGDRPVNMLAWSKQKVGFVELGEPTEAQAITIDKPIKITTQNPDEYFIVEYRKNEGFDSSLHGSGMLITHIDESVSSYNDDEYHKLIDIEEADGDESLDTFRNYGSALDLFATNHSQWSFDENSTPNTHSYNGSPSSVSITFSQLDGNTDSVGITYFEQAAVSDSNLNVGQVNIVWLALLILIVFYVRAHSQKQLKTRAVKIRQSRRD